MKYIAVYSFMFYYKLNNTYYIQRKYKFHVKTHKCTNLVHPLRACAG